MDERERHAGAIILRDSWIERIAALKRRMRDPNLSILQHALDEHEILMYEIVLNELTTRLRIPER